MTKKKIVALILKEFDDANSKYPAFHSTHEGYAVIKEEFDELWDEIKKNKSLSTNDRMVAEAVQVAAMTVKFIYNLGAE